MSLRRFPRKLNPIHVFSRAAKSRYGWVIEELQWFFCKYVFFTLKALRSLTTREARWHRSTKVFPIDGKPSILLCNSASYFRRNLSKLKCLNKFFFPFFFFYLSGFFPVLCYFIRKLSTNSVFWVIGSKPKNEKYFLDIKCIVL